MNKNIIKLSESDIENIVKKVIDEQSKDRNPRKQPKKEHPTNWKGKDSGILNLKVLYGPYATNVTKNKYEVRISSSLTGNIKVEPPEKTPGSKDVVIPNYDIKGSNLPYADNMVKPYFDKYLDAKKTFGMMVRDFSEYINKGGGKNLTNVTIKGSADSGTPTLIPPNGFTELDHPSTKPYNGKTDPEEMNQYLADTRANQYGEALIEAIKKKTDGFVLKITVLKGDNFYGEGDSKRGEEFRKITLTPNAEPHETPLKTKVGGTSTPGKLVRNGAIEATIDVYSEGKLIPTIGYKVMVSNGYTYVGFTSDVIKSMNIPVIPTGNIESQVTNGSFYVDGKLIGKIQSIDESKVDLKPMFKSTGNPQAFAGPLTAMFGGRGTYMINGVEKTIYYVKDTYFVFYTRG